MNASHEPAKRAKSFLLVFALLFSAELIASSWLALEAGFGPLIRGANPFDVFKYPSHKLFYPCLLSLILTVGSLIVASRVGFRLKALGKWFLLVFALLSATGLVVGGGLAFLVMLDTSILSGKPFIVLSRPSHSFYAPCLQSLILTVGSLTGLILVIVFRRTRRQEQAAPTQAEP